VTIYVYALHCVHFIESSTGDVNERQSNAIAHSTNMWMTIVSPRKIQDLTRQAHTTALRILITYNMHAQRLMNTTHACTQAHAVRRVRDVEQYLSPQYITGIALQAAADSAIWCVFQGRVKGRESEGEGWNGRGRGRGRGGGREGGTGGVKGTGKHREHAGNTSLPISGVTCVCVFVAFL